MDKILTALGMTTRLTVGVSVSALNIVEMIIVDKNTDVIVKYAAKVLKYNNSIRELVSYDDFAVALTELFEELNINPKNCNVVLSMPNVHFGFSSLPLSVPKEQVAAAIASDVEQMYLFKRHEPVISWDTINENPESDRRYIVYGAMQETVIQNIKDIFEDLGVKLVAVETSNAALIQGIICSRVLEDELEGNETVNIVLLSSNSYALFCMYGNKLVDYYEEPIAIKSLSAEEVYAAIASSIANASDTHPADNLLIVSEINEVSAEVLSHKINFKGNIKYIERNIYGDKPFMEVSAQVLPRYLSVISPASVGAATYLNYPYPVKFNFLDTSDSALDDMVNISLFGKDYEVARKDIFKIGGIAIIAFLILLIAFCGILFGFEKHFDDKARKLTEEYTDLTAKIKSSGIAGSTGDIYTYITRVTSENKFSSDVFSEFGTAIPDDVYLTTFYSNSEGALRIEGKAVSSEAIYSFMKNLKPKFPDLKISKLQLAAQEGSDASAFSFLIENNAAMSGQKPDMTSPVENDKKLDGTAGSTATTPSAPSVPDSVTTPPKKAVEEIDVKVNEIPSADSLPKSGDSLPEPAAP